MKFKTVREGEQAVVYNHLGEGRLLKGPQRVFLFRERLEYLDHFTATQDEYLVIKHLNGYVTHHIGPCEEFQNPLEHHSISVAPCIKLTSNHLIVVYRRLPDKSVERRVIQGPTVFSPEPEEWLHEFSWHGEDVNDEGHMIPNSRKFTKLPVVTQSFHYRIREVRTVDDTMVSIKLMLSYDISDVVQMLHSTHDPIADLINAICADVIAFVGKLKYQEFLKKVSDLNNLDTFSQLQTRASKIGIELRKIVYCGYQAGDQLQLMQDSAIHARTQMRLQAELENQSQKLTEFKLQKEIERAKLNQILENKNAKHKMAVADLKKKHDISLNQLSHQGKVEIEKLKNQTKLELDMMKDEHQRNYLEELKHLDIDLTEFLTKQQPAAISEEIRVV